MNEAESPSGKGVREITDPDWRCSGRPSKPLYFFLCAAKLTSVGSTKHDYSLGEPKKIEGMIFGGMRSRSPS